MSVAKRIVITIARLAMERGLEVLRKMVGSGRRTGVFFKGLCLSKSVEYQISSNLVASSVFLVLSFVKVDMDIRTGWQLFFENRV